MMGLQSRTEPLFYYFRLEDQIPEHHLLRRIDHYVDFSFVRERLRGAYSSMGRPSIDPEILLRLLLVGYLYGITSERRLVEEVRMHLAYRWFTHLGFEQEIPDHSTFSKNRHGRFRDSGIFLEVFEEVVRRCLEAGLVEGKRLTVDGTAVRANASSQSRVRRQELGEVAKLSKTVREYLAEVEQENPVTDPDDRQPTPTSAAARFVSTTDPEACWAGKGGPAVPSYYDHYLIDNAHGIILGVEATPARFRQEMLAARRMLEQVKGRWGICPESLGADKAYGSGEFLAWLLERKVQPHIPVIDRRHQTPRYFTSRAVSVRSRGECLSLSARSAGAVSWTGCADSELPFPDDRVAMPGMSSEEKVHPGSQSQNLRELVRTGPAGGAGTGEDPSLPAVETRTE